MWSKAFRAESLCGVCGNEPLKGRSMCAVHIVARRRHQTTWYRKAQIKEAARARRPREGGIDRMLEDLRAS